MKSLIIGFVLLIAAISNPSEEDHMNAMKDMMMDSIKPTMIANMYSGNTWETAEGAPGTGMIGTMAESIVHRGNFIVFSFTEIRFNGEDKIIGIGFFGNVWISPNLAEAVL